MKIIDGDKLIHTDNSEDVLQHFGTKGMKWGVRKLGSKIKAAIDRGNERYYNSTKGMQRQWQLDKKYNNAEWKAVQKKTRKSALSPLTKDVLKRQQAEYAKLKSYKDAMNDVDSYRKAIGKDANNRKYVKKEHLAEYDKLSKTIDKYYRPHSDKGRDKWTKAYDRQVELTNIGLDSKYAKASKAYNDYLKG